MAEQPFDLLVIGAGASGASVAYEASRRGLSVALLDAGDIAGLRRLRELRDEDVNHAWLRNINPAHITVSPRTPFLRSA